MSILVSISISILPKPKPSYSTHPNTNTIQCRHVIALVWLEKMENVSSWEWSCRLPFSLDCLGLGMWGNQESIYDQGLHLSFRAISLRIVVVTVAKSCLSRNQNGYPAISLEQEQRQRQQQRSNNQTVLRTPVYTDTTPQSYKSRFANNVVRPCERTANAVRIKSERQSKHCPEIRMVHCVRVCHGVLPPRTW